MNKIIRNLSMVKTNRSQQQPMFKFLLDPEILFVKLKKTKKTF